MPREWVEKDARRLRQIEKERGQADVFLHPNIGYYAGHNEDYRKRVIKLAEDYTREQMPTLLRQIATARIPVAEASR